MQTLKPFPGKFEGNSSQLMARVVYEASLDSYGLGDVGGFGYYSYVEGKRYHFILEEDSQGFVSVEYGKPQEMFAKWHEIETAYEKYCGSEED